MFPIAPRVRKFNVLQTDQEVPDYRSLGLLANPFEPVVDSSDALGVRLSIRAAVLRLLSAVEGAIDDPDHRPIVIEKAPEIPSYYDVAALSEVFSSIASGSPVPGLLGAYVPVDMMRIGRIRAAVSVVAERISGSHPDVMIARWSRHTLAEPDAALEEWAKLTAETDVAAVIERIDSDEAAFAAEMFGEKLAEREGADDIDAMMTISAARQDRLEADPNEDDESDGGLAADESADDDPLGEAFVTPLGGEDAVLVEDLGASDALVREYVLAYTRKNLSPVVARGIEAYAAQGTTSMAQELKVTKAPTKTLAALLRFAQSSFRAGLLMYDRFEMWPSVPDDLRMKIIASLTQTRWAVKDTSVMVLFVSRGDAPELRESFSFARVVPWSFSEVEAVFSEGAVFDPAIALSWIASASTGEVPDWANALVGAVPSDVTIEAGCQALSQELSAAASGVRAPDPAVVSTALEGAERVPPK